MREVKDMVKKIHTPTLDSQFDEEEFKRRKELRWQATLEEVQAQHERQRFAKIEALGLNDPKLLSNSFENFEVDENNEGLYRIAKNYVDDWETVFAKNYGILLHGVPGNGKTFTASCIANALRAKGVNVLIVSIINLLDSIKGIYKVSGEIAEMDHIDTINGADLLVIDDLGAEADTAWTKERIYMLIDARYRTGKPTIITSNLTKDKLKQKLRAKDGVDRCFDRLIEMCALLEVSGTSRRIDVGREKQKYIAKLAKGDS